MITYKKGDLFTTSDKYIIHGCNALGIMGSGVAKIVKEKYPAAYEDYKDHCSLREPSRLLGTVKLSLQPEGKMIINAITQMQYGTDGKRYVSYDAIDDCFATISNMNIPSGHGISMPKIGAGLGGGHWPIIAEIIDYRLKAEYVTIWSL